MEETINLIKKKGFIDARQVLIKSENLEMALRDFYKEFNKISYRISFLRVRDEMIEKELLQVREVDGKKFIRLTEKGKEVYNKLLRTCEILDD